MFVVGHVALVLTIVGGVMLGNKNINSINTGITLRHIGAITFLVLLSVVVLLTGHFWTKKERILKHRQTASKVLSRCLSALTPLYAAARRRHFIATVLGRACSLHRTGGVRTNRHPRSVTGRFQKPQGFQHLNRQLRRVPGHVCDYGDDCSTDICHDRVKNTPGERLRSRQDDYERRAGVNEPERARRERRSPCILNAHALAVLTNSQAANEASHHVF